MAGSSPSLPDGSNPSAAIVQSASDVQCSRLLKTTLAAVMRGLSPDFVTLDDWMPGEIDKQAVHDLIDRALPRLDATQAEAVKAWQGRQ